MDTITDDVWGFEITVTIILFSIITSMFHQGFKKYRFLDSTLESLQQFYLQTESIAQDYKLFPGDLLKFCLKSLCCGKRITPFETLGKILFIAPMAISYHLKILSSVSVINDSSFSPRQEIIKHQKSCLMSQFTKQLEMTKCYFSQKIVAPVMIEGLGYIVFVRQ
jgi:hypothetical protein